jgi:hypothetical protein
MSAAYNGLTTTDTSAPLGGTYSLLDNTGENADAPITYDFLYNMPEAQEDPRFRERQDRKKHNVAHADAKELFDQKVRDDYIRQVGDYKYGTAYALDDTSPSRGLDPRPAIYDMVDRVPGDSIVLQGAEGNYNRRTQREYFEGMGPDYAYSGGIKGTPGNYLGYNPLAFTTLNKNGVTERTPYANTVTPDGQYFNTGYNNEIFSAIPTTEMPNQAIHSNSVSSYKNLQNQMNGLMGNGNNSQMQQGGNFYGYTEEPSSLMKPSGAASGGEGFGLGYSSGTGTGTGTGTGNYSNGYQEDILGLLSNLLRR